MPLCASSAMIIVFHFSLHSRSSSSASMKFVPLSEQIIAGVPRRETNRSTTNAQERTSVHGRYDFNLDSTRSQTSGEKSPFVLGSPTNGDVEEAEVINPGLGKGRRLVCESLLWEVCHDWLNDCCTELSTQDAVCFDGAQCGT